MPNRSRPARRAANCLIAFAVVLVVSLAPSTGSEALVQWLVEEGDLQAALEANEELLAQNPSDRAQQVLRGVILQRLGELEEAQKVLDTLLADDDDLRVRRVLIALHVQRSQQVQRPEEVRVQDLERIVKLVEEIPEPPPELLKDKAFAEESLGRAVAAAETYEQIIRSVDNPSPDVVYHTVELRQQAGEPAKALSNLELVADPDEQTAVWMYNLCVELYESEQYGEVDRWMRRAIQLNPDNGAFHRLLGLSLLKLDRKKDAVVSLARFVELAPEHPEAQRLKGQLDQMGR